MALLDEVKVACRVSSDAFDTELEAYISAALMDMRRAGVREELLPPDSVSGTRWTRCVPLSYFRRSNTSDPCTWNVHSLNPPSPFSLSEIISVFHPRRSAYRTYIR